MTDDAVRAELEALHQESWVWARACCAAEPGLAEDVLHMSYQKILAGGARFDGRSAFKTWLFGVIRLTALDHLRWNWRRWLRWAPAEEAESREAGQSLPGAAMDRADRLAQVRAALQALAARQAEVLRLVFYHELTIDQAAEVMRVSPGSARVHYERGKARLREKLGDLEL